MVSRTSKLILINAVKHSESYNKRQEESEMWQRRRQETEKRERAEKRHKRRTERKQKYHKGDIYHSFRHGGYLEPRSDDTASSTKSDGNTSNKWAVELMRYEESLGQERWGHGGYKELYPEEFQHNDELGSRKSDESEEQTNREDKKKKRKTHKKPSVYLISDSDPSSRVGSPKKRKKHRRKQSKSDSETNNERTEHKSHKRSKDTKKHKRKKSKKERDR